MSLSKIEGRSVCAKLAALNGLRGQIITQEDDFKDAQSIRFVFFFLVVNRFFVWVNSLCIEVD